MATLSEFINFSPHAIILADEKLRVVSSSKLVYSMFGLPSLISGRKKRELAKLFYAEKKLIANLKHCLKLMVRTGSHETFTWHFKQKIFMVDIVAIRIGRVRYYSISFDDISYKYRMDSPLEITRSYLNDILNNLPVGVVVLDRNQHIYMLNDKQLEFFQLTNEDSGLENYLGFQISECLPNEISTSWVRAIDTCLAGETGVPLQDQYILNDLLFSCTISSFSLTDNKSRAIMIVSEDVTESQMMEEKLKISEAKATQLKTLKEINVSIRHEVFNVVTPLAMNAELVKESLDPEKCAEEIEMMESILQSTYRLISFVKQLADIKEITSENYIEGDDSSMISY
jgi:PAS domain-containing protein